jgi:hypothetical protein
MTDKVGPLYVFISAFGVSSFAGLAALLRAGKRVNTGAVFTAMLNSGMIGLGIATLWYTKFQDNIYFLIGICILAGLGGATLVEFVVQFIIGGLKSGGISIGGITIRANFNEGKENKGDGDDRTGTS